MEGAAAYHIDEYRYTRSLPVYNAAASTRRQKGDIP